MAIIILLWFRSYNLNNRLGGLEELIATFMDFMDEYEEEWV